MKMFCDICKVYDEHIFKNELISTIKYFFSNGLVSVGGGSSRLSWWFCAFSWCEDAWGGWWMATGSIVLLSKIHQILEDGLLPTRPVESSKRSSQPINALPEISHKLTNLHGPGLRGSFHSAHSFAPPQCNLSVADFVSTVKSERPPEGNWAL